MPVKGQPFSNIKSSNSVANPRDFKNVIKDPQPRSGGGPATEKPGHRVGMAKDTAVASMNPTARSGGGPAVQQPGHRVGQVREVNPQPKHNPPMPSSR